ncbi:MAG: hypothetical protein ACFFFH_09235 [Candidatus Thorarchaeota archaeon]
MGQEFTDWEIQKTLIWKFETLMSNNEYKEAKKQLIKMGYIKTTGNGVKLTEKGLTYIQEEFGFVFQDI